MEAFHNRFSTDSTSERSHRLGFIQQFSAETIALLSPPAELAAWMQTCETEFAVAKREARFLGREKQFRRSSATDYTAIARKKYVRVKRMMVTIFAERPGVLEECGLHLPVRRDRAGMLEQIGQLLTGIAALTAAGEPEMPSAASVTKLQEAFTTAQNNTESIEPKRTAAVRASAELKRIRARDTANLRKLLALWRSVVEPGEGNIKTIGCYEPKPRRAGMPAPPENVRVENGRLMWDAPERATSFRVQIAPPPAAPAAKSRKGKRKTERINWRRHYQGEHPQCAPPPPGASGWIVRVAARNEHGFGRWSAELRAEKM
jgi:hypothetical protein